MQSRFRYRAAQFPRHVNPDADCVFDVRQRFRPRFAVGHASGKLGHRRHSGAKENKLGSRFRGNDEGGCRSITILQAPGGFIV
jgi:hypothetical protein